MKTDFRFCGVALRSLVAAMSVAASVALPTVAKDNAGDEVSLYAARQFILPGTPTSDDPRRIPIAPGPHGPAGVLVLKGGLVFDAVKGAAYPASVVIERDHIKAILPPGSEQWPTAAKVIDVTGKFVMPGMIDMHVHLTYPDSATIADEQASEGAGVIRGIENSRNYLESGITAVRDLGGVLDAPYILSEWSAKEDVASPRIFVAGHIITGVGGHAADRPVTPNHSSSYTWEVDGADAWRKAVRQTYKDGASVIKIASHFAPDEVKAAVEEAHLLGLKITCHCDTLYIPMAVKAGVDMIEHPLPRSKETVELMARKHIASIPTLQVYQGVFERGGYYGTTSRRFTMNNQMNFDLFKDMKRAGIVMGVGTDTIGNANKTVPNNYITELKWFVKGGYSNSGALIAATRTNAELLDMADKIGTLEPGKLADVVVVDGRPDQRLDDLAKTNIVIKGGYVVVEAGRIQIPRHVATPVSPPPETVH